jgi:hypothetical protein
MIPHRLQIVVDGGALIGLHFRHNATMFGVQSD